MISFSLKVADPMNQIISEVHVGERPGFIGGVKANEGEDLRHIVGYDVLVKILKRTAKGLTPNQIADWLDDSAAWYGGTDLRDSHFKDIWDPLQPGQKRIQRTIQGVQKAMDAWLKVANSNALNLVSGPKKPNQDRGRDLQHAKAAIRQNYWDHMCEVKDVASVDCTEKDNVESKHRESLAKLRAEIARLRVEARRKVGALRGDGTVASRPMDMLDKTVTLRLPGELYHRLAATAAATRRSLEEILLHALRIGSPPAWDDAPPEHQAALAAMDRLDDDALWKLARGSRSEAEMARYAELLEQSATGALSDAGYAELESLRREADRFMVVKAHAAVLLRWRGHDVPAR